MNWEQFRALLWLRWRLLINQLRRSGIANVVILGLMLVFVVFFALGMSITFLFVGASALSDASSGDLMLVWDGIVIAFLFFWLMGLLLELQRSEVLSLDKLLHLPVSLRGAFIINYLSSLFSVCLAVFVPSMLTLTIGLAVARGPVMLLQIPLVAAFILMVTALTYQFQGWLASLMANPRRRRTVIVLVTMAFVLLVQLPNLFNLSRLHHEQPQPNEDVAEQVREQTELGHERESHKIDLDEYNRRSQEIREKYQQRADAKEREGLSRFEQTVRVYNMVLPPGWLPLGAADAADGQVLPALLGTLGMGLIGTVSLWRSYRTTVRLYTGQFSSGKRKPAVAAPAPTEPAAPESVGFLERQLPGIPERAAAIALSGFRSLLRAPEAKMLLLGPIILVLVFGSIYGMRSPDYSEWIRPLLAFGGLAIIMFSMSQIANNQFGFDRAGFRVFVLSAAPRRDILMGKNLALAPLTLVLGLGDGRRGGNLPADACGTSAGRAAGVRLHVCAVLPAVERHVDHCSDGDPRRLVQGVSAQGHRNPASICLPDDLPIAAAAGPRAVGNRVPAATSVRLGPTSPDVFAPVADRSGRHDRSVSTHHRLGGRFTPVA